MSLDLSTTGISFERLRSFLEIAQAGGISRAAKGDPNRQSQMSRQLGELEEFFNTPLVRRGHGVPFSLTHAGQQLRAIAIQQFASLEELKKNSSTTNVTIRIGAGEAILNWLIVPTLASLPKSWRTTKFSLLNRRTVDVVDGVSDGSLDLGLIRREPLAKKLRRVELGVIAMIFVKPKSFDAGAAEIPLAVMDESGRDETSQSAPYPVSGIPNFRCTSYNQIRELIGRKCCAGVLPSFIANDFCASDFECKPLQNARADWKLQAIFNPQVLRQRPASAKAIEELILRFRKTLVASA